mgnify:FL=1
MNEVWNLDVIYRGFDDPAFAADMEKLEKLVKDYAAFAGELDRQTPLDGLKKGIALEEALTELTAKLGEYASLRQSVNTRDAEAGSRLGQVMQRISGAAGVQAAWREWVSKIPDLMTLVAGDETLKDYTFLFESLLRNSTHLLGSLGEQISAKLSMSGSSAWSDLQGYLTSTVPVSYNGGTTNLSAIRNLAYDSDPAVRKAAYEAELSCYDRIKDSVAFALNSIKLETISDCQLRGYGSPLDRTLEQSDMKRETLDAMLGAMEEYMPKFRQYLRAKGKALGHENGLPWYDLFAPMGKSAAQYTAEDAKRILVELFSTFDQELADMVAHAFDEEWIDFYPRDGKTGGAFCAGVECIGQSRILTNFDGTFGSIVTLAHELGHAFHNQCIRAHRPLNRDYSMPVAETASTFNECVVMAAAIRQANSRDEELALIESQLQDVTQIICDIYSRYLFESMVLENREQQFMDADTLCGMMLKAQEQSYGDGLDPGFRHPYMWICKSHYYGATFYNFPYAFGGLFARGLYAQYQREGAAFVPKYKKLLRTTTVATAEDVAQVAGIDLTDKDFWRSALQTVAQQIDLVCGLLEEGKQ